MKIKDVGMKAAVGAAILLIHLYTRHAHTHTHKEENRWKEIEYKNKKFQKLTRAEQGKDDDDEEEEGCAQ